jgi:competence protein CoiA
MRFALVGGYRQEPQPSLSGECIYCCRPMISKCGPIRVRHWAHKRNLGCDPWWENETDWHLRWKDEFPAEWQEIVRKDDESGERHIADVVTAGGHVIEFQYSRIKAEEVRSREAFYKKMIWIVNGWRRDGDRFRLPGAWERLEAVSQSTQVRRIRSKGEPLLRDWASSRVHVFFDFRERSGEGGDEMLWWLSPKSDQEWSYVAPFPRAKFIENHRQALEERASDRDSFGRDYSAWVKNDIRSRTKEQVPGKRFRADQPGLDGEFSPQEVADARDLLRFLRLDRKGADPACDRATVDRVRNRDEE